MEYDHLAELGLRAESQLIISDVGFLTKNDPLRYLCDRFIRNGGKIYDALKRYDVVVSYALSREFANCGQFFKTLVPILKACGVTDKAAYDTFKESMKLNKGAAEVYDYLSSQLPTVVCTESYEHSVMNLAEMINMPFDTVFCNRFSFDDLEIPKPKARAIRESLPPIANCALSKESYITDDHKYLTAEDIALVDAVDTNLVKTLQKAGIMEEVSKNVRLFGNEKAYNMVTVCRENSIPSSDTAYIGTRDSDYPAMDLVRDTGGLAIAFNASEYAVRGSNVAVFSDRPIVAAVIVNEFYNGGIESVRRMVQNWTHDGLRQLPCADRNMINRLLSEFPAALPEVHWVTEKNRLKIVKKSREYRK